MILSFSPRPNVSRWQAIVFDLDDTLYPERQYVLSGFQAVAKWAEQAFGIPAAQGLSELQHLFETGVRDDTFDRWLAMHCVQSVESVRALVAVYRQHEPILSSFPGVPALLLSLRKSYRVGLVSDGYVTVQRRKLDALQLKPLFDAIVFSDELGRENWKPSTKPFCEIVRRLDVDPIRTAYVADNPTKDFLGARCVGLYTLRVRWPEGEYAHLEPPDGEHAADYEISSLDELESTLHHLEAVR